MAKLERVREALSTAPSPDYWKQRSDAGWKLVAVEWSREAPGEPSSGFREEVPFGMQVAGDCHELEENPDERQVLVLIMEMIVQDLQLSRVADELNRQGHRTRGGGKWGPNAVFNLLPRLIEVGPRMFSSEEWVARRQHLFQVM